MLSAEIDHKDPESTVYKHEEGTFFKRVPPMSRDADHKALTVSHSRELFDAASEAYSKGLKCRVLLVKGTKFGTTEGGIRAAADGHFWKVVEITGNVEDGYCFRAERTE